MEMRRLLVVIAVVGLFVGAMAAPASADRGEIVEFTNVFDDIDPCTGQLQTVTLELRLVIHDHGDIEVIRWTGFGSTSLGYVGDGAGKVTANDNMGLERERFAWIQENPETGHAYTVEGEYIIEFGAPVPVQDFVLTCLTA